MTVLIIYFTISLSLLHHANVHQLADLIITS